MADYQICVEYTEFNRNVTLTLCPENLDINDRTLSSVSDISTDDLELLCGVFVDRHRTYKIASVSVTPFAFTFATDYHTAIESLSSANNMVNEIKTEIQGHLVSQRELAYFNSENLASNSTKLNFLTERYGDLLMALDEETSDDVIGQLFRQYINFSPDDNLSREYEFLGGTRKLVIPNLGNYNRIKLPKELTCQELSCLVGKNGKIVNRMNKLLYRMDWECLQIAHKMMDHQQTDNPNGPYWVV
jgi:hypothetical protein